MIFFPKRVFGQEMIRGKKLACGWLGIWRFVVVSGRVPLWGICRQDIISILPEPGRETKIIRALELAAALAQPPALELAPYYTDGFLRHGRHVGLGAHFGQTVNAQKMLQMLIFT